MRANRKSYTADKSDHLPEHDLYELDNVPVPDPKDATTFWSNPLETVATDIERKGSSTAAALSTAGKNTSKSISDMMY